MRSLSGRSSCCRCPSTIASSMVQLRINLWLRSRRNWKTGRFRFCMHEHLKKRDQVREITHDLMQTFGTLQPKLEHFATTPLPDRASVIKILDDLLEVIYPGYFGRKYVESANIEYYVGDLLD